MTNQYTEQAEQFLMDFSTTLRVTYLYHGKHFDNDAGERDIYSFVLTSPRGTYSGKFMDSIRNSDRREFAENYHGCYSPLSLGDQQKARNLGFEIIGSGCNLKSKELEAARYYKPGAYEMLASLTKSAPGSFANFCADFGYNTDSRKTLALYLGVQEEWEGVCKVFSPIQREALAEIN